MKSTGAPRQRPRSDDPAAAQTRAAAAARRAGGDPDHRRAQVGGGETRRPLRALDDGERRERARPRPRIAPGAEPLPRAADQQLAAAEAAEVREQRRSGADGAIEIVGLLGARGIEGDERCRIAGGDEMALGELGAAGERGPVDPGRLRPGPVGADAVELRVGGRLALAAGRQLADAAAPATDRRAILGRTEPPSGSIRGRTRIEAGRARDDTRRGDPERIADPEDGRGEPMAAAARERALEADGEGGARARARGARAGTPRRPRPRSGRSTAASR